ncbi:MAG: DsbA family protein [Actinomycetaceae bacterium]|nr:DsbA family protein [Actinomycetaceae bacterium]
MHVDMWIDLACPWSWLGLRHLRSALTHLRSTNTPGAENVEIRLRPHLLDPALVETLDIPWSQYLIEYDNLEVAEALDFLARIEALGASEGIAMDLNRLVVAPTLRAHALLALAREIDLETDSTTGPDILSIRLAEALFRARFEMGLDLNDDSVLIGCAQDVGIEGSEAHSAITDDILSTQVHADIDWGRHMGIEGVPIMILDEQFLVEGMQPLTATINVLTTALDAHKKTADQENS